MKKFDALIHHCGYGVRCSMKDCDGIIFADTEDWKQPLCYECWLDMGEPESDPFAKGEK
jgi:hypothetical protein